jgi:hypothetical protein
VRCGTDISWAATTVVEISFWGTSELMALHLKRNKGWSMKQTHFLGSESHPWSWKEADAAKMQLTGVVIRLHRYGQWERFPNGVFDACQY